MKHYDGFDVTTRNAIFNFINSNRNFGKTWTFKKRAFKRALKRGKKTIWIRRFKKEVKEATAKFFSSTDLQKFCGIEIYNSKTKKGNLKQNGNTFYVKRRGRWEWFLQIVALSDANNMRSADDVDIDTIVFDEYRTTPTRYARYRGDEVTDFIDIFFSIKREHEVRCFFLGNKESATDPYFTYFNIPQFPDNFEGIRMFKNGGICVQFINNKQNKTSGEYDTKLECTLRGTRYGRYIYENANKTTSGVKIRQAPQGAPYYLQLLIKGRYIRIQTDAGIFFVSDKADTSKPIYTDVDTDKPRHYRLTKRIKRLLNPLIDALTDARIYYTTLTAYEAIQPFYTWLGI